MAIRAAWNGRGSSIRFRLSSRRTNGGRSKPGLIQRATLLNRILADCYGAQELIRSRWLSPALVFAQPDFLRPCHGVRDAATTCSCIFTPPISRARRTAAGGWFPTARRFPPARATRWPTAWSPRASCRSRSATTTSTGWPDFSATCRTRLRSWRRASPNDARVVMLTPGPHNETYFEQAYLARYLGYMLVEGQDLTVRDNCVFLKTLSGLERVDVILRRVDDDFCDPLELRNDSILGVPGLVEALRAGNVVVANALGTRPAAKPGVHVVSARPVPAYARRGIETAVGGHLVVRPEIARGNTSSNISTTWSSNRRSARTCASPDPDKPLTDARTRARCAGTSNLIPTCSWPRSGWNFPPRRRWEGRGSCRGRSACAFIWWRTASGYRVMPGGLARVSPDAGGRFISMQHGGSSKDTWVISETPVEEITLLHSVQPKRRTAPHGQQSAVAPGGQFFLARPLFGARRCHGAAVAQRVAAVQSRTHRRGACRCWRRCCRRLEMQGQLPGISGETGIAAECRGVRGGTARGHFRPGAPRQPAPHRRTICSGWPCRCATAPPTTCGAS